MLNCCMRGCSKAAWAGGFVILCGDSEHFFSMAIIAVIEM